MAAAISAINAKIRSRPVLSYFCSTRKLFRFSCYLGLSSEEFGDRVLTFSTCRFLGPSFKFWHSCRSSDGYKEQRSRDVCISLVPWFYFVEDRTPLLIPDLQWQHNQPFFLIPWPTRSQLIAAFEQNIWYHDRIVDRLLRHIHALCSCSHTEKLSLVRLPLYKLWSTVDARGAISAVLEVSFFSIIQRATQSPRSIFADAIRKITACVAF